MIPVGIFMHWTSPNQNLIILWVILNYISKDTLMYVKIEILYRIWGWCVFVFTNDLNWQRRIDLEAVENESLKDH